MLLLPLPQPKHAPNGLKADARITGYTHEDDVVTVVLEVHRRRGCQYFDVASLITELVNRRLALPQLMDEADINHSRF